MKLAQRSVLDSDNTLGLLRKKATKKQRSVKPNVNPISNENSGLSLTPSSLVIRSIYAIAGLGACFSGLFLTQEFLAAHFSPDGHITELTYVSVFRVATVAIGLTLTLLAVFARVRILQNLLLIMSSILLSLGTLEVTLRGLEAYSSSKQPGTPTGLQASRYPGLYYENTPNFHENGEMKFNSLGMRDEERLFDPDRMKIVVVGDSIEAWRALPVTEMYPRRLEFFLNSRDRGEPVQVVNLAVSGYSLHQKILMLRDRGLAWNPRLVIVSYCLNDPIPAWELVNYFTQKPHSRGLRSLEFINSRIRSALHSYGIDFYSQVHQPEGETWKGIIQDFHDLGVLANEQQLRVILLIVPLMPDTPVGYPWLDIHKRVAEVARQNHIQVIDLLPSFQREGFSRVRADTVHPNEVGHRIAAEKLYAAISEGESLSVKTQASIRNR
jgi:lysophospholipase L1-like esterase